MDTEPRPLPQIDPVSLIETPKPFISFTRPLPKPSKTSDEPTPAPDPVIEDIPVAPAVTPKQPTRRLSLRSVIRRPSTPIHLTDNETKPTSNQIRRRPSLTSLWRHKDRTTSVVEEASATPPKTERSSRDHIFGMNITWGAPHTPTRKLHRKKSVRFTPSTGGGSDPDVDVDPEPVTPPQITRKKGAFLPRFRSRSPAPKLTLVNPPSPAESVASEQSWHHHASYFPEYVSILPEASIATMTIDHSTGRYFPEYNSIYSSPRPYPLDQVEQLAQQHSATIGHAVSVHYPDLPRFADYQTTGKAQWTGVNGSKGMDAWSGYGYQGESLTLDGPTFSAPMPKGEPINAGASEGGGGKKPQKSKGGGGGGVNEEGGNDAEAGIGDGGAEEGGESVGGAIEGEAAGGGGGAGGKKKKKGIK
ncbi:hypothetical protein BCR39DRAFT_25778 [Naematelia encephala]|uniref:Uncharacterized protein n=1 Tax=Naematelia encephala TaxID=71784 RepID=A0A1Y2BM40_9TREE|nr:hypothetical protein BCR39DRAFT_25778 [Naematelia encephala]